MVEHISRDDYGQDIEAHAERLATWAEQDVERDTAYEDPEQAVLDLVGGVLDGHEWFSRAHYGPAAHGSIIEHGDDAGVSLHRHGDITTYTSSDDPTTIVKRLAYAYVEAHVIETATELLAE